MILARLILGLLSLSPMTGYEMKKHFDSSINHFWNADKAQIYRTLAQLVADGYATVETIRQDNYPDRQEHHLTDAGRAALNDWLRGPVSAPSIREPFIARIFFAGEMERDEVMDLVGRRRVASTVLLADYLSQREEIDGQAIADRRNFLMAATLDHGIKHAYAELEWLDAVEKDLP
ncbi:PadR family transcriptional regulator [Paeniglutamicibacter cryotolerans]|nr:PadR family transcriptional regulator [Paeniglutamicibacter cryotolerans]